MVQGDLVNLDGSLLELLTHYQPGVQGVHGVADKLVVTLPVPLWAEFAWIESGVSASVAGGATTPLTVYKVPPDERVVLHAVQTRRSTGDNTMDVLEVQFAEAYKSSANHYLKLIDMGTPVPNVFWPDPAGVQGVIKEAAPSPMTLEPDTALILRPGGEGVSASTFLYILSLVRCKLVRARAPELGD